MDGDLRLDFGTLQLGRVTDSVDPDGRGRVKVRLIALDLELWASVLMPSAGQGYGVALLPKVDEIVVVGHVTADLPVVIGCLWSGGDSAPTEHAPVEERYLIQTPAGTALLFDDETGPQLTVTTPAGNKVTVTDEGGGEIKAEVSATSVSVKSDSVEVVSASSVSVTATTVEVSAASVNVDAAMAKFSGVVKCETLISTSVVSTSYTPGAGNIW